ncbi:MAG: 5-formyltetrahydrofolate cyclo-ligase [Anaerolineaceae bacterium]|nr:5-formyltetrahydrofolate cyclo-ligase [Anaerolineaceae bacterium]
MLDRTSAREMIWKELIKVAKPDSRFHFDFAEFITDFEGSLKACQRLCDLDAYQKAQVVFITPDNCLEDLRAQVIKDGKTLLMTTYGIRRGFLELRREDVPEGQENLAVLLDAIERYGHPVSLRDMQRRYKIDLLVTGGSAINLKGQRFGKGHGFFDLEWAMLYAIGAVNLETLVADIVHDCQVVDIDLDSSPLDTVCDLIITPTRIVYVKNPQKPEHGVVWAKLQPGMMEDISPLAELKDMEAEGLLRTLTPLGEG